MAEGGPRRWVPLWGVALAAALPIFVFACFVAGAVISDTRLLIEQRYDAAARALLSAVDAELLSQIKTLEGLAKSPALEAGDLAKFHAEARRFVAGHGDWYGVVLVDPQVEHQLLNTAREFASEPLPVADPPSLQEVVRTGWPVIAPIKPRGQSIADPFIILRVPVFRNGTLVYVLSAAVNPASLSAIMQRQGVSNDYLMTVFDRELGIVSSSRSGHYVAEQAQESIRRQAEAGTGTLFVDRALNGRIYVRVLERSPDTGWYVAVGMERADFDRALNSTPIKLAVGGFLAMALSAAGALLLGRRFGDGVASFERRLAGDLRAANQQLTLARQQAEARARRAEILEADLKAVMDATPAGIWITRDRAAAEIVGNQAANRIFRIPEGTNVSKSAAATSDLPFSLMAMGQQIAPDELPVQRAVRGELVEGYELDVRFDNGEIRHLYGNAVPLRQKDGRIGGAVSAFIDVTERRRAEARIAESEKRHRTLFEMAPLSIILIDAKTGKLVDFNSKAHEYLGYSRKEFSRLHLWDINANSDKDELLARMARTVAGNRTVQFEGRDRRKDGSLRDGLIVAHPVQLGRRNFIYGMHLDITELKKAQSELVLAKTEAEQANHAKSQFLAAASHDLRQPLQALNLYLGVLSGRLDVEDAPVLTHIDHCLCSLSELLDDLLDLSKLDAGVVTVNTGAFPVAGVLAKVVSAHGPAARAKGVRLSCVSSSLVGRTDPVLFERVVGNLVGNAVRYTDKGGVVVGCRRRQGRLWVEVWDSGIGIPEGKIPEIFEEFKQLGNAERSREKGSGLGLAIVRKTAELLGLEIRAASRLGVGSMFAVELPGGEAVRPEPPAKGPLAPGSLRVALVEDEPAVREALIMALEDGGHAVISAASEADLLVRLGDEAPDLVIADYRLAGDRTGLEVITSVRGLFGEQVKAIILTGDPHSAVGEGKGIRLLRKPVSFEALRECIAEEARAAEPA
jgi:PAS domain S-box-containing protein